MKPKKIKKKLFLNKSTIANLEMNKVRGGCKLTGPGSCPSFNSDCGTIEICECIRPTATC